MLRPMSLTADKTLSNLIYWLLPDINGHDKYWKLPKSTKSNQKIPKSTKNYQNLNGKHQKLPKSNPVKEVIYSGPTNHCYVDVTCYQMHWLNGKKYKKMNACKLIKNITSPSARRKSHHTALSNAATCNSQCPPTVVSIDDNGTVHALHLSVNIGMIWGSSGSNATAPWLPASQSSPKGRRPVRIVGQHACKISCP